MSGFGKNLKLYKVILLKEPTQLAVWKKFFICFNLELKPTFKFENFIIVKAHTLWALKKVFHKKNKWPT